MRLEYKYLVPNDLIPTLRTMIGPFVKTDPYADERVSKDYTVRSIYFDTYRLDFYHEKVEGLRSRKKIRIRGYNEHIDRNIVFLEIKRKSATNIAKNRAPVRYEHIQDLLISGDVERYVLTDNGIPNALENARRFSFHIYREALRPIVLVIYDREAYYSKFSSLLRITLDKNLRSSIYPSIDALFSEDKTLYSIPGYFILEVKFHGGLPQWVKSMIKNYSLKRLALSKYVICLDTHKILKRTSKYSILSFSQSLH